MKMVFRDKINNAFANKESLLVDSFCNWGQLKPFLVEINKVEKVLPFAKIYVLYDVITKFILKEIIF